MNNEPVNPAINPKPNRPSLVRFLGIIGFEIVFVMTSLLLFFGTLNYFNIFPVSDTFPKYLGWLPRKDVPSGTSPNGTSQKTQTNAPVNSSLQNPTPTANPLLEPAKQTVIDYLPTVFTQRDIPFSEISLVQEKETNQFAFPLNKQGNGKATFSVSLTGKQIYDIFLLYPSETTGNATIPLAKQLTSQFFSIFPKGTWRCSLLSNSANYCENFWEEDDGTRKGAGLEEAPPIIKDKKLFVVYCEHKKNSRKYDKESCLEDFM